MNEVLRDSQPCVSLDLLGGGGSRLFAAMGLEDEIDRAPLVDAGTETAGMQNLNQRDDTERLG